MSEEIPPTTPEISEPTFWRKLARIIIRVMLAVVLGFAIGIGLYLGIRAFASQSDALQEQAGLVRTLEARLNQFEQSVAEQVGSLGARLDTLELRADKIQEQVASYDDRLAAGESARRSQATQVSSLEQHVDLLETAVGELQSEGVSVEELQNLDNLVRALRGDVDSTLAGQEDLRRLVASFQQSLASGVLSSQELALQVEMLKAMQLIMRSSSFVEQGNYSQATVDIQAASKLLSDLQSSVAPAGTNYLASVVAVLDEAVNDLPGAPALAANRLEAAWQLLLLGLPADALLTPTPATTPMP